MTTRSWQRWYQRLSKVIPKTVQQQVISCKIDNETNGLSIYCFNSQLLNLVFGGNFKPHQLSFLGLDMITRISTV